MKKVKEWKKQRDFEAMFFDNEADSWVQKEIEKKNKYVESLVKSYAKANKVKVLACQCFLTKEMKEIVSILISKGKCKTETKEIPLKELEEKYGHK